MARTKQTARKSALTGSRSSCAAHGPPSWLHRLSTSIVREQSTGGSAQRLPNLRIAPGFIDIGNSVCMAPMMEEKCISYAERLMPMLQRALRMDTRPGYTPAVDGSCSSSAIVSSGPIGTEELTEDVLIHMLSHLEPNDLAHASAACACWRLAATQVVLSSPWLSRTFSSCGMRLQAAGELGVTIDVDYAALEPFYDGQPSGTGLRCSRAVAASEVVVEYAGLALPPEALHRAGRSFDGTYALGIEYEDICNATDSLMNGPCDYRVHPAASGPLNVWLESLDSPGIWKSRSSKGSFIETLRRELPSVLDARVFGNVSRFIKDERKEPNCAIGWTTASILAGQPHAYVVALQDIAAGVELSIDYGSLYDRYWLRRTGMMHVREPFVCHVEPAD